MARSTKLSPLDWLVTLVFAAPFLAVGGWIAAWAIGAVFASTAVLALVVTVVACVLILR